MGTVGNTWRNNWNRRAFGVEGRTWRNGNSMESTKVNISKTPSYGDMEIEPAIVCNRKDSTGGIGAP